MNILSFIVFWQGSFL